MAQKKKSTVKVTKPTVPAKPVLPAVVPTALREPVHTVNANKRKNNKSKTPVVNASNSPLPAGTVSSKTSTVTTTADKKNSTISSSSINVTEKADPPVINDVKLVEFIRESEVDFAGYNLRPNRQVWMFFDDVDVAPIIARPNILVLDCQKNIGDIINFTPRERIEITTAWTVNSTGHLSGTNYSLMANTKVLLNETAKPNTITYSASQNSNTVLFLSPLEGIFRQNVAIGGKVTGKLSGLIGNVTAYHHYSGHLRFNHKDIGYGTPGSYGTYPNTSTTQLVLGLDASRANDYYIGNVITICTGVAAGQSSNITAYNGITRTANISPALGIGPYANDVYSIGDYREGYTDDVPVQSFYTNEWGSIAGILYFPDHKFHPHFRFRVGDRIFRIIDNPLNLITTNDGEKAYTAKADYRYTTNGLEIQETQVIHKIITQNVVTVQFTAFDPIAESFTVDPAETPDGVFIASVDLCFKNAGTELPVRVQLRPMIEGAPAATYVIPNAEVTLSPDKVKVADKPDLANNKTYTTFTFPTPIYCPPGEYCFVILTNDYGYDLWISEVGLKEVGTDKVISKQPYLGSMFKSQSGKIFTPLQNQDVMFRLNKCVFESSGTISLQETKKELVREPDGQDWEEFPEVANVEFDFFHYHPCFSKLPSTQVNLSYRATSNATRTLDTVYVPFAADLNTLTDERKIIYGEKYEESFNVRIQLETSNPDVSPIVYTQRQSLVLVANWINNMGIKDEIVHIKTGGSGYTSNARITFSQSSTGRTATGWGVANATTQQIDDIFIDDEGAGYFDEITAASITGGGGSGFTVDINSETDAAGGPGYARYIGKTVTLAEGFDAGDLRVYLTAVRTPVSNVQVYFKVRNALDEEPITQKNWRRMQIKGGTYKYSIDNTPLEYEYYPSPNSNNIIYTTRTGDATFKTFNQYKVKIVLSCETTDLLDVPKLMDVRAIALPADVY